MPDLITLTCPTCGARLKVTDQIHLLHCRNCGNEHMVVRNAESIYLAPIAQDVRGIRVGVDKTAAELAMTRLSKEMEALEMRRQHIERQAANSIIPPDFWEKFFARSSGIALLIGVVSLIVSQYGFAFAVGGFFVVVLIGYFVFSETRLNRADRNKTATLAQLNSEINIKREQYRKNRAIAES